MTTCVRMGVRDGSEVTRGGGEGSPARQSGSRSPSRPGLTLSLPSPELPRRDDSRKLAWREDGTLQGGSDLRLDQRRDDMRRGHNAATESPTLRSIGRSCTYVCVLCSKIVLMDSVATRDRVRAGLITEFAKWHPGSWIVRIEINEGNAGTHSLEMLDRDSAFCRRRARVDSGARAPATVTLDLVLLLDSDRGARLSPEDADRSTAAVAGVGIGCAGSADRSCAGSEASAPGGGATAAVAKGDATRAGGELASSASALLPACDVPRGPCMTDGRYDRRGRETEPQPWHNSS